MLAAFDISHPNKLISVIHHTEPELEIRDLCIDDVRNEFMLPTLASSFLRREVPDSGLDCRSDSLLYDVGGIFQTICKLVDSVYFIDA